MRRGCLTCWSVRVITRGRVRRCRWCVAEALATATAPAPSGRPLRPGAKVPTAINPNERPPPTRAYRCGRCKGVGHSARKCAGASP